jgi:aspartyl-tRNA(Asn)/glutamyl-tRNA(Gln) amidotransferase subunit C
MPDAVNRDLVLHLAKLSSLSLSDEEADRLTADLGRIAGYVELLRSLDTDGVPPMAHVHLERMPFREDAVKPCLPHELALDQAPRAEDEGFAVPVFVE